MIIQLPPNDEHGLPVTIHAFTMDGDLQVVSPHNLGDGDRPWKVKFDHGGPVITMADVIKAWSWKDQYTILLPRRDDNGNWVEPRERGRW